jgi:hypothetical protein
LADGGGSMTPSWIVDAVALRATLDSLRSGLERSTGPAAMELAGVLLHDRNTLAASIRDVLLAVGRIDLKARGALSGMVTEYRNPEQLQRLNSMFGSLNDAWMRRLRIRFSPEKIRGLRELLRKRPPDFLAVLDKVRDENTHSQLIRWLLDPRTAPGIAPRALRHLVSRFDGADAWTEALDRALARDVVSVKREYTIGREWGGDELDRIDLVVSAPGLVIAIENKTYSTEGRSQTWAYWRWLASLSGLKAGVFLTPSGMVAECHHFRSISYLDLLDSLIVPDLESLGSDEAAVLASYVRTLVNSTVRTELRQLLREGGLE